MCQAIEVCGRVRGRRGAAADGRLPFCDFQLKIPWMAALSPTGEKLVRSPFDLFVGHSDHAEHWDGFGGDAATVCVESGFKRGQRELVCAQCPVEWRAA